MRGHVKRRTVPAFDVRALMPSLTTDDAGLGFGPTAGRASSGTGVVLACGNCDSIAGPLWLGEAPPGGTGVQNGVADAASPVRSSLIAVTVTASG